MVEQIVENSVAQFEQECRSLDGEEYAEALELFIDKLREKLYHSTNES